MATVVRIGARVAALWALLALAALVGSGAASAAGVALPDGRRYELVSPVEKNGVDVIPQTDKTHVRPDGNAVTFASLGGFGPMDGSSFDFEYLSQRAGAPGTSGWSTHGINPLGHPTSFPAASNVNVPTFVNGFTSDLTTGIYKTWRPLGPAPNVDLVTNLYRITGLNGGPRTAQLMTDSVTPVPSAWATIFNGILPTLIQPQFAGVSSDLTHVVFESPLQLTSDAAPYPPGFCQAFGFQCPTQLYENADGVVRFVGRIPLAPDTACDDAVGPSCGSAASSQTALSATLRLYSQFAVSQDGRRIYFQTPVDAAGGALYLREDGVRTDQVAANGKFWTASADGSRAFFTTNDSLLPADTDGAPDLYMYDRDAPPGSRLTLISTGSAGIDGYVESVVGSSADGHYVYFVCDGQLIAGESPADIMGLYVWHDGQLRFIGTFPDGATANGNGSRVEWSAIGSARKSRITLDGRYLLFATPNPAGFVGRGGFTGYDQAGHREFYLYDAVTGRLACASCNPSGRPATADALIDVRDLASVSQNTSDSAQALSDDGRRVFFNTADALVAEDTNNQPDAYEYDAQTGSVHLLSSGRSATPSYFIDASPSGDDVFIVTRERLVGWDTDDKYDLYDVRVGGGFPDPPAPAPGCSGVSCRPGSVVAPGAPVVGSRVYRGLGDVRARLKRHHRRCAGRRVLRKVRGKRKCVRGKRRHAKRAVVSGERSGR